MAELNSNTSERKDNVKVLYFFKDGDYCFKPVRISIPTRYSFNSLLTDLTKRMPDLPYGVRNIATSHGRHYIHSISEMSNKGNYVCSTSKSFKGMDPDKVHDIQPWKVSKPASGQRSLSQMLREPYFLATFKYKRRKKVPKSRALSLYTPQIKPKRVKIFLNGNPRQHHVLLFNRKTKQTFEEILSDLSDLFGVAVHRIYTCDGLSIHGLTGLFNGPDFLVAAGKEGFRPMNLLLMSEFTRNSMFSLHRGSSLSVSSQLTLPSKKLAKNKGTWSVLVHHSSVSTDSSNDHVSMTVYGHSGVSKPITLMKDGQFISTPFEVHLHKIGNIFKIRLTISTNSDGVFLIEEVKLNNTETQETILFPCKKFANKIHQISSFCYEIPAVRDGKLSYPIVQYEVDVVIGDLWDAGSSAVLFITIFGDHGDSGLRKIEPKVGFVKGQNHESTIDAVSLGTLRRIAVSHNGSGPGSGMFLDKINIKELSQEQRMFSFICGRWLDEGEDDGVSSATFKVSEGDVKYVEKYLWESEKWKFVDGNILKLYSKVNGQLLQVQPSGLLETSDTENSLEGRFKVHSKSMNICLLESCHLPGQFLSIDHERIHSRGHGGLMCEMRVHMLPDRSVAFESVHSEMKFIAVKTNGQVNDVHSDILDNRCQFFVQCQGRLSEGNIIVLHTSWAQTLQVTPSKNLSGKATRSPASYFIVRNTEDAEVKMFESFSYLHHFLCVKNDQVTCKGNSGEEVKIKVVENLSAGYATLQPFSQLDSYITVSTKGHIELTKDGDCEGHFWIEVVQFADSLLENTSDDKPSLSPDQYSDTHIGNKLGRPIEPAFITEEPDTEYDNGAAREPFDSSTHEMVGESPNDVQNFENLVTPTLGGEQDVGQNAIETSYELSDKSDVTAELDSNTIEQNKMEPVDTEPDSMVMDNAHDTDTPDTAPDNTQNTDTLDTEPDNTQNTDTLDTEPDNTQNTDTPDTAPDNTQNTDTLDTEPDDTQNTDTFYTEADNTEYTNTLHNQQDSAEMEHTQNDIVNKESGEIVQENYQNGIEADMNQNLDANLMSKAEVNEMTGGNDGVIDQDKQESEIHIDNTSDENKPQDDHREHLIDKGDEESSTDINKQTDIINSEENQPIEPSDNLNGISLTPENEIEPKISSSSKGIVADISEGKDKNEDDYDQDTTGDIQYAA